jgi:hypothetical protein
MIFLFHQIRKPLCLIGHKNTRNNSSRLWKTKKPMLHWEEKHRFLSGGNSDEILEPII